MRLRSALQVTCTALLVWICVLWSASSATRRVVLLFDERPELPGLAQLEAELVRTLGSSSAEPIEVYREAMDPSQFSSDAYEVLLRDFTTKDHSMGMGLCIAHAILEAHGGKISAEGRPDGAVFHVSLPLAKT